MECPKCKQQNPDEAKFCSACGAPLNIITSLPSQETARETNEQTTSQTPYTFSTGTQNKEISNPTLQGANQIQLQFNIKLLTRNDLMIGGAIVVCFLSLFLSWYQFHLTVNTYFGAITSGNLSFDALYHGYMYIALVLELLIVAHYINVALGNRLKIALPDWQVVSAGVLLNAVLFIIAFLDRPGPTGWDYGAFLGLIVALIAVAVVFIDLKNKGVIKK
jgi:hypothetical protein